MLIAAGYLVTLGYVFFLIFVLGEQVRKRAGVEASRKVIHTMLFMVWVLIDIFFRQTIHQIVIPVIFLILNALSYRFHLYGSVEREEQNHMGTVYFAMAITVTMTAAYFVPELYLPSGAAAFCLTFGDGFAALVGYHTRSRHIHENKTLNGFLACFVASVLAMAAFRLVWWHSLSVPAVLLLAAIAAIAELTLNGLDNFTLTFAVFAASRLLGSRSGEAAALALGVAVAVFLIVFFSRAITYGGALLSMGIVFVFAFFGGPAGIGFLLATYFSIFAVGLVRRKLVKGRKGHGRNAVQILINGGMGTLAMLLHGLTGQAWWMALSFAAIGGCFIDSVSSDVGTLSKAQPWDPIRRRTVPAGVSGGMSVLGTGAAAVFSALIALYCGQVAGMGLGVSLLVGSMSFVQTLLDTAMGSVWQRKNRCAVCGEITEKAEHCSRATVHASGLRWMDNNMVNLLSSMLTTGLTALLLRLM